MTDSTTVLALGVILVLIGIAIGMLVGYRAGVLDARAAKR